MTAHRTTGHRCVAKSLDARSILLVQCLDVLAEPRERLEQADLDRTVDRLRPDRHAELPVNRDDLCLDRVPQDTQALGDLVVILVLDVLVDDYDVSTAVLVPLLLTVAGLLSVDLPRLRP